MALLGKTEHFLYLSVCVEIWLKLMRVSGNAKSLSRPTPKDQDFYSETY